MDETQLLTFLQSFAIAEIVPVPVHVVEATERTPRGPPAPPLPALDFSGAGALGRDQFISKLKEAIYPGTGHHREGALSPEAMRLLAANLSRLLAFDRLREVMNLAAGNELLLLTPVSALCPLALALAGACDATRPPQCAVTRARAWGKLRRLRTPEPSRRVRTPMVLRYLPSPT